MGAKESMVTAPLVVVLFDRVFLFDSFRAALAARWRLYVGLALTWLVLAVQLVGNPRSGSAGFGAGISVWTYLLNQSVMIVRYLRLAVWPSDLVINYGSPVPYSLGDVFPQAAVVLALLVLTIAAFRWNPRAAFLAAVFFITLAPSSSFVPIATEAGAERRMYLPLMALATAIVVSLYSVRRIAGARAASSGGASARYCGLSPRNGNHRAQCRTSVVDDAHADDPRTMADRCGTCGRRQ